MSDALKKIVEQNVSKESHAVREIGNKLHSTAFLPIERRSVEKMKREVRDTKIRDKLGTWRQIDISFLSQRLENKKPRWVVFPVFWPAQVLGFEYDWNFYWARNDTLLRRVLRVPGAIRNAYNWHGSEIRYKAPRILLPNDTRRKAIAARHTFRRLKVFLIMEADDMWEEVVDPLIVALADDKKTFYFIDAFDTTSAEEYVTKEFVV